MFSASRSMRARSRRGAGVIVVVGLVLAFVLIAVFSNRATRGCRWREYPAEGGASRWVCAACGAGTVEPRGRAPRRCLATAGKK